MHADEYDAWYETPMGIALFAAEVSALRPLLRALPGPHLEVGVGTGRFAAALGVEYGLDPSVPALEMARRRGIGVAVGVGEAMPFGDSCLGAVLLAFTLCFVEDPARVAREMCRVLVPGGGVVLGLLPRGTPWADSYAARGAEGHPVYSHARFYTVAETMELLEGASLRVGSVRSTLFQVPGQASYETEESVEGVHPEAGFVCLAATRGGGT